MIRRPQVLGVDGKPVKLTPAERYHAQHLERRIDQECAHIFMARNIKRVSNALGYQVDITTLTTVLKSITEQKFYTIPFATYLPVKVGEGAWSNFLLNYRSFDGASPFEDGILQTGADNARLATATAAVDSVTTEVFNWAKGLGWNIIELYQASKSGNWDIVTSKEKARKRNWDLGLQQTAFLGLKGNSTRCRGLLNQPSANVDTTTITEAISGMTSAELNTFAKNIVQAYRSNSTFTAYPTHFIIPESDFNGLGSQMSEDFPLRTKMSILLEVFQLITMNQNFKILPVAYADAAQHVGITGIDGLQVYTLLNYDEDSLRMNIPVDYTNTMQNTLDGFNFQSAGYGQFTGVTLLRPLELLYFTYTAP